MDSWRRGPDVLSRFSKQGFDSKAYMIDDQEINERISKCEKILATNPGSQIFAALAEAHRKNGDLDKAFHVCQKGLKSHPSYGSAHVVMAKINLDKGLYDWAETEVEKASKQGGNVHAIEILRCEILIAKGELESAERSIRKQLKKDPSNSQLKKLLESLKVEEQKPAEIKFPGDVAAKLSAGAQRKKNPPLGSRQSAGVIKGQRTAALLEPVKAVELSVVEVLEKGVEVEGVFGALRQDDEGAVFESHWEDEKLEDEYSSAAFEAFRNVDATLKRVDFGSCQRVLVESEGVKMYFLVGEGEHFVFFADPAINTNRLRANLNRVWKAYKDNPHNGSQK